MGRQHVSTVVVRERRLARGLRLLAPCRKLCATLFHQLVVIGGISRIAHRPAFKEASMKGSRLPSSTLLVSPISTPVRRSLMRDWSSTYERIWLPQLTSLLESSRTFAAALRLLNSSS